MSSDRVDLTTIEQNRELYLRLAELDIAKLWEVLDEDLGEFNG
jgi:hypothetical protein